MNKLVSIIVAVYNVQDYLPRFLDSVKNQDYDSTEIILVNDGSTDNSKKILEDFCKQNKNAKLFTTKNHGLASARNFGYDKAKGEFIFFCDSDDILDPKLLSTSINAITSSGSDMCCFKHKIFYDENEIKPTPSKKNFVINGSDEIAYYLMRHQQYNLETWGKVFKKETLDSIKKDKPLFDSEFLFGEDTSFILKVANKVDKCVFINANLYWYRMRPTSLVNESFSNRKWTFVKYMKLVVDEMLQFNKAKHMFSWHLTHVMKNFLDQMMSANWDKQDISKTLDLYKQFYKWAVHHSKIPWYKKLDLIFGKIGFAKRVEKYIKKSN